MIHIDHHDTASCPYKTASIVSSYISIIIIVIVIIILFTVVAYRPLSVFYSLCATVIWFFIIGTCCSRYIIRYNIHTHDFRYYNLTTPVVIARSRFPNGFLSRPDANELNHSSRALGFLQRFVGFLILQTDLLTRVVLLDIFSDNFRNYYTGMITVAAQGACADIAAIFEGRSSLVFLRHIDRIAYSF